MILAAHTYHPNAIMIHKVDTLTRWPVMHACIIESTI